MPKLSQLFCWIFAGFFLVGALANAVMLFASPEIYRDFGAVSFLLLYKRLWQDVIDPYIQVFVSLVIVFELALAILLVGKNGWVKIGLSPGTVFMLFLVPFWWFGGSLINLVFAAILLWLTRFSYPDSLMDWLSQKS